MKNPNDTLVPWVRWMIDHKLRFVVILILWMSLPVQVLSYTKEAIDDISSAIWNLK